MSIEFSPRAALCTAAVLGGFAIFATARLPFAFLGFGGAPRDGLLTMRGGSLPRANLERDILGAVLAHEARLPDRANVCLRMSEEGRTFEREKRAIRGLQQRLQREPGARSEIAAHLERLSAPERAWQLAAAPGAPEAPLPPESAASLRVAERDLIAAPRTSGVEIELDGSAVPPALRSSAPGCNTLFFSAPAVAGEIAFVETRFECGPGCVEERLYAVVLREQRWMVAATDRL